jgi:hypothetical protein
VHALLKWNGTFTIERESLRLCGDMTVMASKRHILFLALAAVVVLAVLPFGLPLILDVDGDDLSRDVADTAHLPWWTGALSTTGLMMWAAAAAVCALAAAAVSRRQPERSRFLAATTALLLLVALDDALQFHETVGPEKLGVPESVCYGVILVAAGLWGLRFLDQIFASRVWLLALVAMFFVGSILSDLLVIGPTAAEDWLKNSGIAVLLIWCADTSLLTVRSEMEPVGAPSEPRQRREPAGATPPPAR